MKNKGIKYRMYPTEEQEKFLLQEVGNQRFIWNYFLDLSNIKYKTIKEGMFYSEMCMMLTSIRSEIDFLKTGNSQSLQQTLKDLDQAFKNFFIRLKTTRVEKAGYPIFKKKGKDDSFRVPQHFTINKSSITIPKIGNIRINKHQPLNGKPKNLTIKKEGKKWYVSITLEFNIRHFSKTNKTVGIDLGTVRFATGNQGQIKKSFLKIKGVDILFRKIKTTQKELARKDKFSNNWIKAKFKLGKLHRQLANKRRDFHHKFSTMLVKRHDLIVVEDLKTSNMTRSAKGTWKKPGKNVRQKSGLNRSILSQGWYSFISMLDYKCDWYGKILIKVDPKFTSQICSSCGYKRKTNRKSQSSFVCGKCGTEMNADVNAARNILTRGLTLAT